MPENVTKLKDLIDPEVMADMISAKLPNKIRVTPFAKMDTTLEGSEGDTITVPKFKYIGDAEDVAEGVKCGTTKLQASSTKATVKKVMKAVDLTDEAVLSAHGDAVGEATNQLALSVAAKVDNDCIEALSDENAEGRLKYNGSENKINYDGIVDAIDLFEEEVNGEKAMFVHPKQVTDLRHDPNFISADKYNQEVVLKGETGMIANTRIVPTKKVKLSSDENSYLNPIIKIETEEETEDETPALTIYRKRDVNVETERDTLARKTVVSIDELYTAVVSNEAKLVLAKFKAEKKTVEVAPEITSVTVTPESSLKAPIVEGQKVATISVVGGTQPYTYKLNGQSDNFKVVGTEVQASKQIDETVNESVTVTVTDSKQKTKDGTAQINITKDQD